MSEENKPLEQQLPQTPPTPEQLEARAKAKLTNPNNLGPGEFLVQGWINSGEGKLACLPSLYQLPGQTTVEDLQFIAQGMKVAVSEIIGLVFAKYGQRPPGAEPARIVGLNGQPLAIAPPPGLVKPS